MDTWQYELTVVDDRAAIAELAAQHVARSAASAVAERDLFTFALSGGSTPRDLFRLLAAEPWRPRLPWGRTHVFWGDERGVPPNDERSNFRLAREMLLDHVPIPAANVHRPFAERIPDSRVASEYAEEIRGVVPSRDTVSLPERRSSMDVQEIREAIPLGAQGVPSFDLILLGLGDDGHTASLLPGSKLVRERERLVAITDKQREGTTRVTFTPPLLRHATELLFLVSGADKAPALREVLEGEEQLDRYPAQVVRPAEGKVVFIVDRAAAKELSNPS